MTCHNHIRKESGSPHWGKNCSPCFNTLQPQLFEVLGNTIVVLSYLLMYWIVMSIDNPNSDEFSPHFTAKRRQSATAADGHRKGGQTSDHFVWPPVTLSETARVCKHQVVYWDCKLYQSYIDTCRIMSYLYSYADTTMNSPVIHSSHGSKKLQEASKSGRTVSIHPCRFAPMSAESN